MGRNVIQFKDKDNNVYDVKDVVARTTKADVIINNTESASVTSVKDAMGDMPVKTLEVQIDPVQDLHGYDNPWTGGGGKNLLPLAVDIVKAANTTGTWSGNNYTIKGITYTLNTDSDGNIINISANGTNTESGVASFDIPIDLPLGDYILNGLPVDSTYGEDYIGINVTGSSLYLRANTSGKQRAFSATEEHHAGIVWLAINGGTTVSNRTFFPMVRLSTETDGTFVPYMNVCPISGWTSADVTRHGNDLIPTGTDTSNGYELNKYLKSDGTTANIANPYTSYVSEYFEVVPGKTLRYGFGRDKNITSWGAISICFYDSSKQYISGQNMNYVNAIYPIVPSNATYARCTKITSSTNLINYCEYENSYTYAFPQSAGTVYGGTLTIRQDGTGTLVVDRGIWTLDGTETGWDYTTASSGRRFRIPVSSLTGMAGAGDSESVLSDKFVWTDSSNATWGHIRLAADYLNFTDNNSVMADKSTFLAWLSNNNTQVFAPLSSPVPYDLTAQQVVSLLKGTNNIWSNTGNTAIEYAADTKLYIDGKIAELQALILEN